MYVEFDSIVDLMKLCVSEVGVSIYTQDYCMHLKAKVRLGILYDSMHYSFETVFTCTWN